MKKLYCISGLGADERIFMRLQLKDVELVHIPWPEYDKEDELACYAQKVSTLIPGDNPIILGVSMGGMIGVEISKIRPVKKLVLISSAKTKSELPPYDGLFGKLMKSEILPPFLYKMPNSVMFDKFGAETDQDEGLLTAILKSSDGRFMKWAMKAVALWENKIIVQPIVHIHGRQDKMIFPENIHADYWIEDGGHMMVYNRAEQVSQIIQKELDNI